MIEAANDVIDGCAFLRQNGNHSKRAVDHVSSTETKPMG